MARELSSIVHNATDLVAWHHLRVEVPWTWEVTAYAIEDRVGRLEFNDRHGLLATIGWEPCDREPDRDGTMRVFLQNNVLGKDAARRVEPADLEVADIGPFRLGWDRKGAGPCQALAWHRGRRKLLRWTFEPCVRTGGLRWDAALRPILSTWGFNDGPETEYRLRGLHCRLPAGYELEDVVVLPANVKFVFEHAEHRRRAIFRRWGMERMARMVESHNDISLQENVPFSEREAVFLADKFVCGSRFTPIMERYEKKLLAFAGDVDACAAIRRRRRRALSVLERFERESGRDAAFVAQEILSGLADV